jgi:hypothetical protein
MRIILLCILTVSAAAPANALPIAPYAAVHAGGQWHDGQLEDYRWEMGAHGSLGAEAGLELGAWQLGLRVMRSNTQQGTGIPGETGPDVRLTESAVILGRNLLSPLGFDLRGHLALGVLHVGYEPDSAEYSLGGGSTLSVDYAPMDEWQIGAGLGLLRQFAGPLALGLHAEYQRFGLDTAYRSGTDIEEQRDRFGFWTVRASLHFRLGGR